jgi:predicted TIM-barrel fold metal-dependent hydrolase
MANEAEVYDGPVVDAQHHLYRQNDIPWLQPGAATRLHGDHFGLARDFLAAEFLRDVRPHGVIKSVHMTANRGVAAAVEETRWLQSVADEHGFPHAFVVQADLTDEGVEGLLKKHLEFPNVRGVRHQLQWESHPHRQSASRPDLCNTPEFRRGFKILETLGLHFELQAFASQAKFTSELARDFPSVRFIVIHAGLLTDPSSQPVVDQWRAGLAALAASPNVWIKISGLGMFTRALAPIVMRQTIRDAIQIFGAERTIYAANFPLEKLWTSYADLFGAYRKILGEYSLSDQRKIFHDNAIAFYRI